MALRFSCILDIAGPRSRGSELAVPVASRSAAWRQVPASASPIARAGVRIGRAESINARHAREALLLRGVAAVDPAMAGAVIRAPAAISAGASCGQGQGGECD